MLGSLLRAPLPDQKGGAAPPERQAAHWPALEEGRPDAPDLLSVPPPVTPLLLILLPVLQPRDVPDVGGGEQSGSQTSL